MDAMGTMRDLDQIREHDDAGGSSRLMSLAMGGLATACVLFAVGVMVGRESGEAQQSTREDPLARLDQLAQQQAPEAAAQVTWPERLTGAPAAATPAPTAPAPAAPTPAAGVTVPTTTAGPVLLGSAAPPSSMTVRLSGAPLAAPSGLAASPLAAQPAGPAAPAGSEGAFSVQVSSFRSVTAAQQFAARLRERGHHAFVAQPATAPNGVVWHRVRIGPFTTQREASAYRAQFEARERMPTIVVRRDQEPFHAAQPAH